MDISKPNYISFMVRLWREEPEKGGLLIQVEDIPRGGKRYFNEIEELFIYIRQITAYSDDKTQKKETSNE